MSPENPAPHPHTSLLSAVLHHVALVAACVALGGIAGWGLAMASPGAYASTVRVLVNPAVGNPYAPTPASVRQDELTSLETEAQMVRSDEVLSVVADPESGLTKERLSSRLQVTVPPSTQILEITYTASDAGIARQVADAIAYAYLDNRAARFEDVQEARIAKVEAQTERAISDLRASTAAAQVGTPAKRAFNSQLADALRNELVSLRAQRSALENSESPVGAIVSPASVATNSAALNAILLPVGGLLLGLALGCLIAFLMERARGVVHRPSDSEASGMPVLAAVPPVHWYSKHRRDRKHRTDEVDTAIRRLRASVFDMDPRPQIITVGPVDAGSSSADVAEAVAHSFARAGHPVVLLRHDNASSSTLIDERGLAHALFYERLNVRELLQPSVEPLLSVLVEGGFTPESREFLTVERLRDALRPLTDEGHLVVIEAPADDSTERDAYLGAADLSVAIVTTSHTRRRDVERMARETSAHDGSSGAFIVNAGDLARLHHHTAPASHASARTPDVASTQDKATRTPR